MFRLSFPEPSHIPIKNSQQLEPILHTDRTILDMPPDKLHQPFLIRDEVSAKGVVVGAREMRESAYTVVQDFEELFCADVG